MTCYLSLQQGGHLQKNDASGFLLLNVCDGPLIQPLFGGPGDTYWERLRYALDEEARIKREISEEQDRLKTKQKELELRKQEDLRLVEEDLLDQQYAQYALLVENYLNELLEKSLILQDQIRRLRLEEDDALVILYSLPFMV